jgi:hypothetical protein
MRRLTRLRRDEAGMSLVFVGMGLMAFVSASILAIDVGMLMTARSQAQNSADAGALAGAVALFYDDFDDRTADRPGGDERHRRRNRQPGHGWRSVRHAGRCGVPERRGG